MNSGTLKAEVAVEVEMSQLLRFTQHERDLLIAEVEAKEALLREQQAELARTRLVAAEQAAALEQTKAAAAAMAASLQGGCPGGGKRAVQHVTSARLMSTQPRKAQGEKAQAGKAQGGKAQGGKKTEREKLEGQQALRLESKSRACVVM
uniref:Uncharacterized protein n=1 Tax=Haptolina ericina TaxID=156174 RepID=A0A7S3FEM7_9EUKA|mmetsp:Transcript_66701/g.148870  ORF Transcript_66701/g.148870 Transcript_66701/m.148870 type:complete len:149 (+) Transcript_66701:3-449(+)